MNDIDNQLMNFFRVVKENQRNLSPLLNGNYVARVEFERLASLNTAELTDIQAAHRFYYTSLWRVGAES